MAGRTREKAGKLLDNGALSKARVLQEQRWKYSSLSRDHVFCSLEYSLLRGLFSSSNVLSGIRMGHPGKWKSHPPWGYLKDV